MAALAPGSDLKDFLRLAAQRGARFWVPGREKPWTRERILRDAVAPGDRHLDGPPRCSGPTTPSPEQRLPSELSEFPAFQLISVTSAGQWGHRSKPLGNPAEGRLVATTRRRWRLRRAGDTREPRPRARAGVFPPATCSRSHNGSRRDPS